MSTREAGMRRSFEPTNTGPRPWSRWYVSTPTKFFLALAFATCWTALSAWISLPWIGDLAKTISIVPAVIVVSLLAFVPGHLVAFLVAGVVLDRQPPLVSAHPTTPITVLVAARNESSVVADTLAYIAASDYDGDVRVLLIDNGSDDGTADVARQAGYRYNLDLTILSETRPGKSHALNRGLAVATTPLIITVDADTVLHKSAIRLLVARLQSSPDDVTAVAGGLMVRNSRASLWSRMQSWDYLFGIAAVKRVQGVFQGTLVAQGAFSVYRTDAVRDAGGWPDAIGEDIVLTWRLLQTGRVYYEPLALAFTGAPTTLKSLARQRSRWARGMLEGIRAVPPWRQRRHVVRALAFIDLAIPLLDMAYVFLWLPGLVLACFGYFWIVGPMTAAIIPVTATLYWRLYRFQQREVLRPLGLTARRDPWGFLFFFAVYQALMSAMSLLGYSQELLRRHHTWK